MRYWLNSGYDYLKEAQTHASIPLLSSKTLIKKRYIKTEYIVNYKEHCDIAHYLETGQSYLQLSVVAYCRLRLGAI